MKTWNILVTGSNGLIGSEAVEYFDRLGHRVTGIDNNMRRIFFGAPGDTQWNLRRLREGTKRFTHIDMDLRDRARLFEVFAQERFDVVLHCAAQPSHDKAAEIPLLDFEVNTVATIYLLEAVREHCPDAAFIFLSTNKVYGEAPNERSLKELPTRYDYAYPEDFDGIDEIVPDRPHATLAFRSFQSGRGYLRAGVRKIFWAQRGNFPGWLHDRAAAFRRGTARLSVLSGESGDEWRELYDFWVQGQAGA